MQKYHLRSNVESTFSAIKRKFGDSVKSKTDTAMVNEVLCKILCHNLTCLIQEQETLGIAPILWDDATANIDDYRSAFADEQRATKSSRCTVIPAVSGITVQSRPGVGETAAPQSVHKSGHHTPHATRLSRCDARQATMYQTDVETPHTLARQFYSSILLFHHPSSQVTAVLRIYLVVAALVCLTCSLSPRFCSAGCREGMPRRG